MTLMTQTWKKIDNSSAATTTGQPLLAHFTKTKGKFSCSTIIIAIDTTKFIHMVYGNKLTLSEVSKDQQQDQGKVFVIQDN